MIDSLIIAWQDFDPARHTRGGSIMQISQTRVVDPVIMYRAVGGETRKERQREASDKDSTGPREGKRKRKRARGEVGSNIETQGTT